MVLGPTHRYDPSTTDTPQQTPHEYFFMDVYRTTVDRSDKH